MQRTIRRGILVLAALAVFVVPIAVSAAGGFTDVADDNIFKADIQWMADNDITRGCNPPTNDKFCPSDVVTRETMSAFMHRLGVNQVVDAKTAITAEKADEADNADTVDGVEAADLMTEGFLVTNDSAVTVPQSGSADVASLNLGAGSYVINARLTLNQNDGTAGRNITCTLTAGTTTQKLRNFWTEPNGGVDSLDNTFMIVHTFDTAGQAVLSCTAGANWTGNVINSTISAIRVSDVTVSVATAGSSGDIND